MTAPDVRKHFEPGFLYAVINLDSNANPVQFAEDLFESRVATVQIRAKDRDDRTFFEVSKEIVRLARLRPMKVTVLINDRVDLCELVDADGVHVGQDDLPPHIVRSRLGAEKIIGFSTHSLEQVAASASLPVDYIGFGPIFPTQSKRSPEDVVGCAPLSEVLKLTSVTVVAIGGVTAQNVDSVYKTGVRTVAVIRDLEEAPKVGGRVAEYFKVWQTIFS